jgi:hypothetical protein
MNRMMMLFVQATPGLSSEAVYASLIVGLVGVVVGVLLAWLLSKVYPSPEERAKERNKFAKTAYIRATTLPPQVDGAQEIAEDDDAASQSPTPYSVVLDDLRETSRLVGASLGTSFAALINKVDELDPLLRAGRGGDQEVQTAVKEGFDRLHAELSKINQGMLNLPAIVQDAVGRYFEEERRRSEEAQRQREEQFRREREEAESQRRDEVERKKQGLRNDFRQRLEDLRKSDLVQTSLVTSQIANSLKQDSPEPLGFEDLLPPYLRLLTAEKGVYQELSRPDLFADDDLDGATQRMESRFKEVEAAREDLERKHKPAWLVDLLEKARGHHHLEERAQRLKELLNLEDVPVDVGTELEARHMDDLEVVEARGYGKRKIVSEVLGNGYRLKETGAVVRKPRVVVSLEG